MSCCCRFLVLALLVSLTLAQTFQYSRGWTNGKKRSEGFAKQPSATGEYGPAFQRWDSVRKLRETRQFLQQLGRLKQLKEAARSVKDGKDYVVNVASYPV